MPAASAKKVKPPPKAAKTAKPVKATKAKDAKSTEAKAFIQCVKCKATFAANKRKCPSCSWVQPTTPEPVRAPAPTPPLGPQLSAIAGGTEIALSLDQLVPHPDNLRTLFLEQETIDLAESIRTLGLIDRIAVRPKSRGSKFEVIDGHRRRAAIELLPRGHALKTSIPCIVREMSDDQVVAIMVATQSQKKPLRASEMIRGYQRLETPDPSRPGQRRTAEQIAAITGDSPGQVRTILRRSRLPQVALDAMDEGKLAPAIGDLLARVPGERSRAAAVNSTLAGEHHYTLGQKPHAVHPTDVPLSYRETRELLSRCFTRQLKDASFGRARLYVIPDHPDVPSCEVCPSRAGNNAEARAEGTREDVCLDPTCFALKTTAHTEIVLADAKRNGQHVISDGTRSKVFWQHGSGTAMRSDSGYLDLDGSSNGKTFRSQVKGKLDLLDVAIGVDYGGGARELIPVAVFKRLTGDKSAQKELTPAEKKREAEEREERAERAEENAVNREVGNVILFKANAIAQKLFGGVVPGKELETLLRSMLTEINGSAWSTVVEAMAFSRGHKGKTHELRLLLDKEILESKTHELLAMLVEYHVGHNCLDCRYGDDDSATILGALGLDRKAIEKQAKATLRHAQFARNAATLKLATLSGVPSLALLGLQAAKVKTIGDLVAAAEHLGPPNRSLTRRIVSIAESYGILPLDAEKLAEVVAGKLPPEPEVEVEPSRSGTHKIATSGPMTIVQHRSGTLGDDWPDAPAAAAAPSASELHLTDVPGWPLGMLGPLADAKIDTLVDLQTLVSKQDPSLDHEGKIYAALRSVHGIDPIAARNATDALLDHLYADRQKAVVA